MTTENVPDIDPITPAEEGHPVSEATTAAASIHKTSGDIRDPFTRIIDPRTGLSKEPRIMQGGILFRM